MNESNFDEQVTKIKKNTYNRVTYKKNQAWTFLITKPLLTHLPKLHNSLTFCVDNSGTI